MLSAARGDVDGQALSARLNEIEKIKAAEEEQLAAVEESRRT
jgi:hypothetical protein